MRISSHQSAFKGAFRPVALAAAIVALTACGGGGDSDPTVSEPSVPEPPPKYTFSAPAAGDSLFTSLQKTAIANAGQDETLNEATAPGWCYWTFNPTKVPPGGGGAPGVPDLQVMNKGALTLPPVRIFDDVVMMGTGFVTQLVVQTSAGHYFIDTLNRAADVVNITIPGMRAAGLSLNDTAGIMITHGHGDHHGGLIEMLTGETSGTPFTTAARLRPRSFLGSGDRSFSLTAPNSDTYISDWVNSNVRDPVPLQIGDKNITLLATQGHTNGTTSSIVPVTLAGKTYKLWYLGGQASQTSNTPAARDNQFRYRESAERLYRMVKADPEVVGTISSHGFYDGSVKRYYSMLKGSVTKDERGAVVGIAQSDEDVRSNVSASSRYTEANHPFLPGREAALRSSVILRNCAAANAVLGDDTSNGGNGYSKAASPDPIATSAWRFTTTKINSATGTENSAVVEASVLDVFGPVGEGVQVSFELPSGSRCSAATNASGVASCTIATNSSVKGQQVVAKVKEDDLMLPRKDAAGHNYILLESQATAAVK